MGESRRSRDREAEGCGRTIVVATLRDEVHCFHDGIGVWMRSLHHALALDTMVFECCGAVATALRDAAAVVLVQEVPVGAVDRPHTAECVELCRGGRPREQRIARGLANYANPDTSRR